MFRRDQTQRRALGLALATTISALVYDPRAEAADPKRVFCLGLAVLGVSAFVARPALPRTPNWAARAGLGFFALSALSLAFGLPVGARDLGTLGAAFGTGLLAIQLGPRGARYAARLSALSIGGLSACIASVGAMRETARFGLHAGQGNPNWLGLLLAVTLPLSLDAVFAFRRARGAGRALAVIATLLQLPALYLSHSRVAWLAAGAGCVAFFFFSARRRLLRALVLLPLAAISILVAASNLRSTGDVSFGEALEGRAWIWRHSASAALGALPFGEGLGRFGHAFLDVQGQALSELTPGQAARRFTNATTAHNDYLQAALESGPIAAALLAAAFSLGVCSLARRRWLGGAAALGACAFSALGDSPLRQPAVVLLVGLLLGAPRHAVVPARRLRVRLLLALGALLLLAFSTERALRAWLGTRERVLARDAEPREQILRFARATRFDPASGENLLELGLAGLRLGDPRGASEALRHADLAFADTGTRIALGEALLEASQFSAAARAFERALAWNSGSFRARLGLARARLREGRLGDAEREAVTAHRLLPGDPRGRELLDSIREAKMDSGY